MKIAIYSGNIPSTTFIENLINGLAGSGFEILLFGKLNKEVPERKNVKIISTPKSDVSLVLFVMRQSLKLLFKDAGLLTEALKISFKKNKGLKSFFKESGILLPMLNNQPDVFHIQWSKTVEMNPELFRLLKSKIAVSLRGAHINYSPLNDKKLADAYMEYFPQVSGFHAVSDAIGKEAMKYGASKEKISTIYTSVKDDLLNVKSESYRSGTLQIISVGRFHWKKGYHYAIDAMKKLKDDDINFHYTIVAQGVIPEEIIFLLDEYELKDKVTIIGGMEYNDLIERLKSSHLLLLPSVEEGIANVVLEAMATGVAVISTDCGGMEEAVSDGINGYVVRSREPEEIVEKVKRFLNENESTRRALTDSARKTVREKFSAGRQVKEFSDFYNSMKN